MKRKVENLLKNNKVLNITYTAIGSFAIRLLGLFVKKEKGLVLFVSYMGKNFNDSPKVIYDELIKNGEYSNLNLVWAFNDVNKYKLDSQTKIVKMDSLQYLLTALKAEYWITNVNIERGLHFKKEYTKYINTWHGIPIKKIGNDVKGRSDFDFSSVNLFCYSGNFEYEIYKKAFKLKDTNLFKIGMPRNEVLLNNKIDVEFIKQKLNIHNKKVVLYAPTWRDNKVVQDLIDFNLWDKNLDDEYVFLIKMHGLSEAISIQKSPRIIDVSDYEETYELLLVSDILVTDYSSILFDYSLLNKPIILYTPDYKEYKNTRGVYFELDDLGLANYKKETDVIDHINGIDFKFESIQSKKISTDFFDVDESSINFIIDQFDKRKTR